MAAGEEILPRSGTVPAGDGIDGNWTGSRAEAAETPDFTSARSTSKRKMIDEWVTQMKVGNSEAAERARRVHVEKYPDDDERPSAAQARATASTSANAVAAYPASDFLADVRADGQVNGIYCGPASGLGMIKTQDGVGFHSRKDGNLPYQVHMANYEHMQTDYYGATDWARGQWRRGVNNWRGTNYYTQVGGSVSSAYEFSKAVQYAVNHDSKGVGVSTVEYVGKPHYNEHPNRLIGHWIWAYGFSQDGAYTHLADPAHSLATFPDSQPRFSIGRSTLWLNVEEHGYVN